MTADDFVTNVDSYSVGHSSAFVPAGAVRIHATSSSDDVIVAAYIYDSKVVAVVHALYWEGPKDVAFEVEGVTFKVTVDREASVTLVIDLGERKSWTQRIRPILEKLVGLKFCSE